MIANLYPSLVYYSWCYGINCAKPTSNLALIWRCFKSHPVGGLRGRRMSVFIEYCFSNNVYSVREIISSHDFDFENPLVSMPRLSSSVSVPVFLRNALQPYSQNFFFYLCTPNEFIKASNLAILFNKGFHEIAE